MVMATVRMKIRDSWEPGMVMAAMGLFDVQGGSCERPTFQIGSPLFDKIEIKLSPMNATEKRL